MLFRFMLAVLATWRVTHLLTNEDGPWEIIARVRQRAAGSLWGRLMDCFKCVSLWVAAPLALFATGLQLDSLVTWLALSGSAIIIQEVVSKPAMLAEELTDDLLQPEAPGPPEPGDSQPRSAAHGPG